MSELRKIDIDWAGRQVAIEHQWLFEERVDQPLMVFLHEGLGSAAMWKDFPRQLCEAAGMRGLVYSRPGYGGSTPRSPDEHWQPDYMHRQATEVLPALLAALEVAEPPWLFGHSDGASIALIYTGSFPGSVAGVVAAAPHEC
jgi:pimeloyl-ACP methyl ester carboxylesterase